MLRGCLCSKLQVEQNSFMCPHRSVLEIRSTNDFRLCVVDGSVALFSFGTLSWSLAPRAGTGSLITIALKEQTCTPEALFRNVMKTHVRIWDRVARDGSEGIFVGDVTDPSTLISQCVCSQSQHRDGSATGLPCCDRFFGVLLSQWRCSHRRGFQQEKVPAGRRR